MNIAVLVTILGLLCAVLYLIDNTTIKAPKVKKSNRIRLIIIKVKKSIQRINKRKLLLYALIILLLLVFTNPGIKRFKEFSNGDNIKRNYNFIIFSVYENDVSIKYPSGYVHHTDTKYYLGILLNFFELKDY